MPEVRWDRTHGDSWEDSRTMTVPMASAAPPVHGGGTASADASATTGAGAPGGLSNAERPSMWELLTDTAHDYAQQSQLTVLLEKLEESSPFRRGQVAGALADLQYALEQVSHLTDGDTGVSLPAGTVVVIAHTLLRHQP